MDIRWNRDKGAIAKGAVGIPGGLLTLANEAKRLMDPYVPADQLALAQNVRTYVEGSYGVNHYQSPYAHYQWEGKLYVDPITKKGAFTNGEGLFWSRPGVAKKPTGKKLKYRTFRHPLATSHWEKAMMAARKEDLARAYENYLRGRL